MRFFFNDLGVVEDKNYCYQGLHYMMAFEDLIFLIRDLIYYNNNFIIALYEDNKIERYKYISCLL